MMRTTQDGKIEVYFYADHPNNKYIYEYSFQLEHYLLIVSDSKDLPSLRRMLITEGKMVTKRLDLDPPKKRVVHKAAAVAAGYGLTTNPMLSAPTGVSKRK